MPRKRIERPQLHAVVKSPSPPPVPSIGLALGGGGARGLAHILMLEAFDELGIKPKLITGTSIGAMMGAAYASGVSGAEMRAHTKYILSQRFSVLRDFFAERPLQRIRELFPGKSALLDPAAVLDVVMPKQTKADFESLPIPLKIVASDYYDQEPQVFTQGPLGIAVAASMALPAIFQPVIVDGKAMIDGGLTNPLPYDLLEGEVDIIVAIDVSGAPVPDPRRPYPTAMEALFASAFLFERTIVREKLKTAQPDILITSGTQRFQLLDILKVDEILAAAEPAKERLKAQLQRVLSVETLPQIAASGEHEAEKAGIRLLPKRKRKFLSRRKATDPE
ncbi:MAG: patatin-like phospholipase family protein [Hyphomicrobium sp.]